MVAPEHDIATLGVGAGIPGVQNSANLIVDEAHTSQVGLNHLLVVPGGHDLTVIVGSELGLVMSHQLETLRQVIQIVGTTLGHDQTLEWIPVQVFLRSHPGHMGLKNSQSEKKMVAIRFQGVDPFAHRNVVGHLGGRHSGHAPTARRIDIPVCFRNRLRFFAAGGVLVEFGFVCVVEIFTYANALPALSTEVLWQSDSIGNIASPGVTPVEVELGTGARRMQSGEEGGSRGETNGRGTDRAGESDTASSKAFEIRRDRLWVTFEYAVPVVPIVNVQEKHAGAFCHTGTLCGGHLKR